MIHFLGIGAQKAASTWFYEHLRSHPQIRFPAGKEIHFWDDEKNLARGISWWLGLFPPAPGRIRQGEITPAYAILDREKIARIHALAPHLRIFYCLRNPIERAWSQALMGVRSSRKTVDAFPDDWFLARFHSDQNLKRGRYTECLRNWRAVYSPDQLAVVFFDDIVATPRDVLARICTHLGVSTSPLTSKRDSELKNRVFEGMRAPIRPALLSVLRKLYEPEIRALSVQFDRNLDHWLEWDGEPVTG